MDKELNSTGLVWTSTWPPDTYMAAVASRENALYEVIVTFHLPFAGQHQVPSHIRSYRTLVTVFNRCYLIVFFLQVQFDETLK